MKLALDDELRSKLKDLHEPIELFDETGRSVGWVLPEALYEDLQFLASNSETCDSGEELNRRLKEHGRRTVSEIWKSLTGA